MLGWTAGVGLGELLPPPAGVSCSGLPCWGSPDRSEGNWRGTDSEGLVPPCALIVRRGTDSEGLVSPRALIVRRGTGSEGLGTSTCPHGILGPALDLGHLLEVSLEPPGLGEAGGDGKMYPCQEAEAGARPRAQAQSPPRACWRLGPSEGSLGRLPLPEPPSRAPSCPGSSGWRTRPPPHRPSPGLLQLCLQGTPQWPLPSHLLLQWEDVKAQLGPTTQEHDLHSWRPCRGTGARPRAEGSGAAWELAGNRDQGSLRREEGRKGIRMGVPGVWYVSLHVFICHPTSLGESDGDTSLQPSQ